METEHDLQPEEAMPGGDMKTCVCGDEEIIQPKDGIYVGRWKRAKEPWQDPDVLSFAEKPIMDCRS